jgi:RiboL-PSP-HEPN
VSVSRAQFKQDLDGLTEAVALDLIATGATHAATNPGVVVLRRGILIAALIALETFVRDRTSELLQRLGTWPARYDDLPQKLRDASLLNALSPLLRYATMLKRQQDDYQAELVSELKKMSSNQGPSYSFTKFVAGDYTGNISDSSLKDLLSNFQVNDCWNSFRVFSSDIGFGVPSVHELIKDVVRKRHRSAHSAGFIPTAADIANLAADLLCIGLCFDIALSASVEQALVHWKEWSEGERSWRDTVDLYFVDPYGAKFRLKRHGLKRSLHVLPNADEAKAMVPRPLPGRTIIIIYRDLASKPISWDLI